jgi:hypothetical protein
MVAILSLLPIPWTHETSELGSIWNWGTTHFAVRVIGDMRSFYYSISQKTAAGIEKPFADGNATTFAQAEEQIRGTIGKAYDSRLGYRGFAGQYATTFMLATGEVINLAPYLDKRVFVTVLNPDGSESRYEGLASVVHYELVLLDNNEEIAIAPSYINKIEVINNLNLQIFLPKVGRITQGRVSAGCTGRPGFMPDTVEHDGHICPIHEE